MSNPGCPRSQQDYFFIVNRIGSMQEHSFYSSENFSEVPLPVRPRHVDLNSASMTEIAGLPMIGRHLAAELILHRPFQTWTELKNIPGFTPGLVDILKNGGARLS